MNKSRTFIAAAIASTILVVGFSAHVVATTVTGQTADAELLTPVTITPGTSLDFGQVSPDPVNPTTVVLDPTAAANPASSVDGAGVIAGTAVRADFALTAGVANQSYTVNFTVPGDISASGSGCPCPANSVEINALTWATLSQGLASGQLSGTGTDTLWVGGTLSMAGAALGGTYQGTYSMDVVYN